MSNTYGVDPSAIRTPLDIVRRVVDDIEAGLTPYAASKKHDMSWRSAYRWADIAQRHPGWPTADDIATQAAHAAENELRLRRRRYAENEYRSRVAAEGLQRIPVTGTARRIRALMAIGWTQNDIATRLGVSPQRVSHLATEHYDYVHRSVARRVAEVYDALSMTPPGPQANRRPYARDVHVAARARARRLGWAPPLAWDDDTIDDPATAPHPAWTPRARNGTNNELDPVVVDRVLNGDWRLTATRAERLEVARRWNDDGGATAALERLTGWNIAADTRNHQPEPREESAA